MTNRSTKKGALKYFFSKSVWSFVKHVNAVMIIRMLFLDATVLTVFADIFCNSKSCFRNSVCNDVAALVFNIKLPVECTFLFYKQ